MSEFDAVQKYIEDAGTVYPVLDGRITLINAESGCKPGSPGDCGPGSASRFTVSMSIVFVTMATLFNYYQ